VVMFDTAVGEKFGRNAASGGRNAVHRRKWTRSDAVVAAEIDLHLILIPQ